GSFQVPDPANFGSSPGDYTLIIDGNGAVNLRLQFPNGAVGTWTVGNGSNGGTTTVNCSVTFNSGGTLQITSTGGASKASCQIWFTTSAPGQPQGISLSIASTGASGFFIKGLNFLRTA